MARKWVYTKYDKRMLPHSIEIEKIKLFPKGIGYSVYVDGLWVGSYKTLLKAKEKGIGIIKHK